MRVFLAVASLFTIAFAMPGTTDGPDDYMPCYPALTSTFSSPQCCIDTIGGMDSHTDVDCTPPGGTLTCSEDFTNACDAQGKTARCCAPPMVVAFFCVDPLS
ncbi:hypothetical protein FB45DRAFT_1034028 [Roridomyces roridus]|uniref:Cerato-ulmin n=1 Tax=Roridomyces roridus TaxID=1738132 RepID=A0AAD7BE02_9AGAR|nr:hypothetical protein FB45DRAFT_1034028 [Roridomyces roridus]